MAGFTESALSKKIEDLNASQQSIQTLSLWLIHNRKHYQTIVKTWTREIISADEGRQLTLMYLANDVIQNSKKKGPEYSREFGTVLRKAFELMGGDVCSEKTKRNLNRILTIWEERLIYDSKTIKEFRKALATGFAKKSSTQPSKKKRKIEVTSTSKKSSERSKPNSKTYDIELDVSEVKDEFNVPLSPKGSHTEPPETNLLIKALSDLDNAASSDEVTRNRISSYPPEVSDTRLLSKLEDKKQAQSLLVHVNEALTLVADYNTRLVSELGERKKVSALLKDYIQAHRDLLRQAENRLQEYKDKLKKICDVRNELQNKLRNLPDMSQLPEDLGSFLPLPPAGDLFNG